MTKKVFQVDADLNGERLDKALTNLSGESRSLVQTLVKKTSRLGERGIAKG